MIRRTAFVLATFLPLDVLAQTAPTPDTPAPTPIPAESAQANPPASSAQPSAPDEGNAAKPAVPTAAPAGATQALEAPEPSSTPLTTAGTAVPEAAPIGPKTTAVSASKLDVGTRGFFQPGMNLQAWFFLSRQDTTQTTFQMRRAELRAKGEIIPERVLYLLVIDPAKTLKFGTKTVSVDNQNPPPTDPSTLETVGVPTPPSDTSILQDVAVTLLTDYADVSIGQYKIPVSYEGVGSSSKLLFPERSLVSRYYGDRRDIGVKAEKKFERFGYMLGLYNGQGQNQLDTNNQKDASLRVELYPIKGFVLAGVGYVAIGQRDLAGTKDRVEGDVHLEIEHALLQAEYIRGWDRNAAGARIQGQGAYAAVGYTFAELVQPVVRIGFLDPNVDSGNTTTTNALVRHYELCVNTFVRKDEVKVQTSYGVFDSRLPGAKLRHEVTISTQVAF